MAYRELIKIGWECLIEVFTIIGDHQLGEKSKGVSATTSGANIISAEQRLTGEVSFELEMEEVSNELPFWIDGGGAANDRVIARDHDGMVLNVVLGEDDS